MRRLAFYLLWIVLPLVGCSERVYRAEVAPYLVPCTGYEGQFACLMVRDVGETSPYLISYEQFDGFQHQWGHTYELEYTISRVDSGVGEDAPPVILRTTRVVRDDLVEDGTEFSVVVRDPPPGVEPQVELTSATGGRLLRGVSFQCTTDAVCRELESLLSGTYEAQLGFAFEVGATPQLMLTTVEPLF